MQRIRRPRLLLALCSTVLVLFLVGGMLPAPARAQEQERCFAETGSCIRGAMLTYWEEHGGLAVFGYPITDLRLETIEESWTGPVQWFERDRLEDHGIDGILAGRLGASALEQQGFNWWEPANQSASFRPECLAFDVTGYQICEPFLSYWQNNGGLDRFGYPLTEAFNSQVGDWEGTIQYFERRRMEYHPEIADSSSQILLGHLGKELLQAAGKPAACTAVIPPELHDLYQRVPFRSTLGCPRESYRDIAAAEQMFERGRMLWLAPATDNRQIIALSNMPALFQRMYADTWRPESADAAEKDKAPEPHNPPPGLLTPAGGFGKVWRENEDLPQRLGWATANEHQQQATAQRFDHGWLIWAQGSDTLYALGAASNQLIFFKRPQLMDAAPGEPALLAGYAAPKPGGELVVRTQSIDFYRLPGGLTTAEIYALADGVEAAIASGSTMMGTNLAGRIALQFEPPQQGPCAIRGLTLSNQRTIRMFYAPGSNLHNIESILAHEFVHQLQHDYYGAADHLRSDTILLEGMATWASGPYALDESGQPYYHAEVEQALNNGTLLPLTTSLDDDCRTTTRNTIYEQWASFTEYLLITYGRGKLDAVYADSAGRPAGSSNYQAVYGQPLAELEAAWVAWLQRGRQ